MKRKNEQEVGVEVMEAGYSKSPVVSFVSIHSLVQVFVTSVRSDVPRWERDRLCSLPCEIVLSELICRRQNNLTYRCQA